MNDRILRIGPLGKTVLLLQHFRNHQIIIFLREVLDRPGKTVGLSITRFQRDVNHRLLQFHRQIMVALPQYHVLVCRRPHKDQGPLGKIVPCNRLLLCRRQPSSLSNRLPGIRGGNTLLGSSFLQPIAFSSRHLPNSYPKRPWRDWHSRIS
jgi:hypothetical protein